MNAQDLKNSILQLAVQGKLVEQRLEEGSAKELLEQIKAEKGQLIKDKKIKKEKPLPEITDEEKPFDIPESWEWVRLGEFMSINSGKNLVSKEMIDEGIPVYGGNGVTGYHNETNVDKETIVIGRVGFYCGSVHVTPEKAWVTDNAFITTYTEESIDKRYLVYVLRHLNLGKSNNATAQPVVSGKKIYPILFPLPPLAEQKRIVAKIEEILPYIEQYDKAYTKLEIFNKKFPLDMKKSILQLAMQGKLVEQRPEEGTAEELYQQIVVEKSRLIKEGKIKKEKPLAEITDDEIPFGIPKSWKWVRLGNVLDIARGASPRPIKAYITSDENGVNWIKIGDSDKGGKYINSTSEKITLVGKEKSRFVEKGSFLLSNSMSFGRPYILNIDGCIHDGWLVLSQRSNIFEQDYLYYLLSSSMVYYQFCSKVSGAVVNNLNSDKVRETIVPLPPLAEQKRIVARLEEMLPYCEQLIK